MKICVLHSSYEFSAAPFKNHDPTPAPARYLPEHSWALVGIHKATAVAQVTKLVSEGYDVFVNLCDGAADEDRAGIEVVQTLERLGAAFTGAGSEFYDPTRETMKRVCHYCGIKTPRFVFARELKDMEKAVKGLRFPLFVKHPNSYGSVGITAESVCRTAEELEVQVRLNLDRFGGALIEEFIDGREYTVLVSEPGAGESEPRTYMPVEFTFPPNAANFKTFDLKWVDWEGMGERLVSDNELNTKLQKACAALFTGLRGEGYGRCDVRVDSDGQVFMLEMNPNCGIFYPADAFGSADFILSHGTGESSHSGFLRHIIECALRRQERNVPIVDVVYDPVMNGYELQAARTIPAGTVVLPGEERPLTLVTKQHVDKAWDKQKRTWFGQYAWPVGEGVYAMWSDKPGDWRPINHSCDPNCWLDGLDMVARRSILKGESVTIDYSTFCAEGMEDFNCQCGAEHCRHRIRATDYKDTRLTERFGSHVSEYVKRNR